MSIEPEFQIEDLDDTVVISVTLKGRSASKCDLVVADLYAKFNLSPYFLIIDFPELVSPKNICATAKSNDLMVRIKKESPQKWPTYPWSFPKDELKQRREESFQRLVESERARIESERISKENAEKEAMQRAWELEKEQRDALKAAQEEDKQYAYSRIHGDNSSQELKNKPLYEPATIAPTRSAQVVQMVHTPTMKSVPARYEGPNRNFIVPKKGDASPLWMKQQGDVFYKNGDFKSAINAYTEAINGSDRQFVAAFSNRAASRLKIGLPKLALNDCDEALALIQEPILTADVAMMKVRLLSRKAEALFEEKRYAEALESTAEILKYQRENQCLKDDVSLLMKLAGNKLQMTKEIAESIQKILNKSEPKTE
ncbi:dyslexia susceptibility 1 candidate 1 protein [Histomonas meleagridis]|uniref:dyslexia susceptibility 1 candidate 1 protein-like n=1 Tax=Histomonas meleagridis TaxID=135588 RepID=UPI00355A77B6|nr:dyslexia susceptibility 1 candidate 1 protein [Histomonas meleagridis]KAH0801464.1 dyslexia susceptibility 1 candidate 1 protein-like [Histomonas meleagridis]